MGPLQFSGNYLVQVQRVNGEKPTLPLRFPDCFYKTRPDEDYKAAADITLSGHNLASPLLRNDSFCKMVGYQGQPNQWGWLPFHVLESRSPGHFPGYFTLSIDDAAGDDYSILKRIEKDVEEDLKQENQGLLARMDTPEEKPEDRQAFWKLADARLAEIRERTEDYLASVADQWSLPVVKIWYTHEPRVEGVELRESRLRKKLTWQRVEEKPEVSEVKSFSIGPSPREQYNKRVGLPKDHGLLQPFKINTRF